MVRPNGSAPDGSAALAAALNPRQRRFAEGVAGGRPASAAYRGAGYGARGAVAEAAASRLLREVKVAGYLDALQAEARAGAAKDRDDYRDLLTSLAWDGSERTANRLRAGDQLAKLMGWGPPERLDVGVRKSEELAEVVADVLEQAREARRRSPVRQGARPGVVNN